MKRTVSLVILVSLVLGSVGIALPAHAEQKLDSEQLSAPSASPEPSPLIARMRALDSSYRAIVSAVALGENDNVQQALAPLVGFEEQTSSELRSGTILLPKNPARLTLFLDIDKKFNRKLTALNRAASHNNQREMQRITQMLLSDCVKCHQSFRK